METNHLKRNAIGLLAASLALCALMAAPPPALAEGGAEEAKGPSFTLGRFVTCQRVEDREPVGVTDTFGEDTVKVYVFLETLEVKEPTAVRIKWMFEGKETALIDLELGKSSRWRTYSSKRIGVRRGAWEVRLLDSSDRLIKSLKFTVK